MNECPKQLIRCGVWDIFASVLRLGIWFLPARPRLNPPPNLTAAACGKLRGMTAEPIRTRLLALAGALRHFHSALLDVAKSDYEFLHGKISSPFTLYNLVTGDPAFQWLRPLSGLMSTLDEVTDQKGAVLTERHLQDVRQAYALLFSGTDTRFSAFKEGYEKARHDPQVKATEQQVQGVLDGHEA